MTIEVNLLPFEMRRVEHTPLPRFLVIIVGTALIAVTLAYTAVIHYRKVPDARLEEARLVTEISGARRLSAEYDTLQAGIEEVRGRKQAIAEIWRARISWSQKLAQVSEMMPRFIGLTGIKLESVKRSGRDENVGGYLTLASICAGGDLERLSNVRRILEGSYPVKEAADPWVGKRFFVDFIGIEATPAVVKPMDDTVEGVATTFDLKMTLKSDKNRIEEFGRSMQPQPTPTRNTAPSTKPVTSGDKGESPGDQAASGRAVQ